MTAELDVDFSREKTEAFARRGRYLRDQFFDEKMNGVDWNAMRTVYEPHVAGARTPDEMRRIFSLMLGELNASHMGIAAPPQATQTSLGRLAADFDRAEYEARRPAARQRRSFRSDRRRWRGSRRATTSCRSTGMRRRARQPRRAARSYRSAGASRWRSPRAGRRRARGRRQADGPGDREGTALSRSGSSSEREYVAKMSGGRLGYVHMFDMSAGALAQLHVDLDADNHAREGVVIDVRNNNGGFVNVYAIDVFARRGYLKMTDARRARRLGAAAARAARAGAADHPRHQPALAVGRGGFHRRLPLAEAGQGRGRTDRRLDHLHRRGDAD